MRIIMMGLDRVRFSLTRIWLDQFRFIRLGFLLLLLYLRLRKSSLQSQKWVDSVPELQGVLPTPITTTTTTTTTTRL
ncbi:hypothetical protein NC651_027336 [Populus alba x Populus x berolinensis]|nr:hypothetical protein NC651_027336 [Populus alba x Populus x berolinensis]